LKGNKHIQKKRGHNFTLNSDFSSVNVSDYDGLYIPGGRSPEYLRLNPDVISLVKQFVEKGKLVSAICHGPLILSAAQVIKGKKCTSYPACKASLISCGAIWTEPEPITIAETDGNLITAAAWPAHPDFLKAILKSLGTVIVL